MRVVVSAYPKLAVTVDNAGLAGPRICEVGQMENEMKGVIWALTGWFALAAMGSAITYWLMQRRRRT
jgi:hypothetical protein